MSDSDLISLYSGQILALAANIPHTGKLENAMGVASKRSPQCGSSLTAYVRLAEGNSTDPKVADFSQEVRACALGQASAAILGQLAIGRSLSELQTAHEQLQQMLAQNAPAPASPFDGYEVLRPAHGFKNRHASILLALEALIAAVEEAHLKKPSR